MAPGSGGSTSDASTAAEAAERLEKLLQQIARQFNSDKIRPPDAAARAVGRQTAQQFLLLLTTCNNNKRLLEQWSQAILEALCRVEIHLSIPHAFFDVLIGYGSSKSLSSNSSASSSVKASSGKAHASSKNEDSFLPWLSRWTLQMEEVIVEDGINNISRGQSGVHESLTACIHAYAFFLAHVHRGDKDKESEAHDDVHSLLSRLRLPSTRAMLCRECIQAAFDLDTASIPALLSPIISSAVLTLSVPVAERTTCLQHLWRASWNCISFGGTDPAAGFALVQWMTTAYTIYVTGISCESDVETQIASTELAAQWLTELAGLAETLWMMSKRIVYELTAWLQHVLRDCVPRLALQLKNYRLQLEPVLTALQRLVEESYLPMDAVMAYKLSTLALSTPIQRDTKSILALLIEPLPSSVQAKSLMDTVMSMYQHDDAFRPETTALRKRVQDSPFSEQHGSGKKSAVKPALYLIDLIQEEKNELIDMVANLDDFAHTEFSAIQQIGALMFGLFLLDDEKRQNSAFSYFKNLLARYPHLGISLLPLIVDRINQACAAAAETKKAGLTLMQLLEFLCEALVVDPHCAQEVWSLVGVELMAPHVPIAVRLSLIRLFPRLCVANKRLYRRVIDTLRVCVAEKPVEVRLAVAATIAELAKDDSIRDVSDVIAWIQSLLTEERSSPMHSLLVYYAVLSLHHLVVAEELDFEVVIKVLNKRLCPVTDLDAILKLPLVVLEALTLLLGDGECGFGAGDSDKDDREERTVLYVEPQVIKAVETLVHLGNSLADQSQRLCIDGPASVKALSIVKQNIYESLSRYSLCALGVTEEGIREVIAGLDADEETPKLSKNGVRYSSLKKLVLDGLETPAGRGESGADKAILKIAGRLLEYEEEVLGGSLWQKRARRQQAGKPKPVKEPAKVLLSTLPSLDEVRKLASDRNSPAAAASLLLASDGKQLSVLRDNGDACIESPDPLFLVFAVQGYLNFAARTVSQEGLDAGKLLTEVSGWFEIFVSPDTMYLALSSLCLYIPHTMCEPGPDGATYVREIFDDVLSAFKNQHFQKDDVAKICLGLISTSALRYGAIDRVDEIITMLEQSVRGYGGQVSFGAYYALALIGQALPQYVKVVDSKEYSDKVTSAICRVVGFLLEELLSCFEGTGDILLNLVACVKSGTPTPDLVDSLSSLGSNSISLLMTKHIAARYLFISGAYCFPALAAVNGDLLLAISHLLSSFEWGSGIGIALPPVLRACQTSSLLESADLERIYTDYASDFEARMDIDETKIDTDGLEDVYYAVTATSTKPIPDMIRRRIVGNHALFDDDSCALSLMASVWSITSDRCLGATYFVNQVQLDTNAVQANVDSIIKIVAEAANMEDSNSYAGMGMIMMGFLSSIGNPRELSILASSIPKEAEEPEPPFPKGKVVAGVDFAKLPCPQVGTLLAGVMEIVEWSSLHQPRGDDRTAMLTRLFRSLERLSLPGAYANQFLAPMFHAKVETPVGCTSLLCSQVRGRRRAVFDGSDFTSLAVRVLMSPEKEWRNLLGSFAAQDLLIDSLLGFSTKFSTDDLAASIENVWRCTLPHGSASLDSVSRFLSSMKDLVQSTSLSPKAMNATRSFVIGQILDDLQKIPLDLLVTRSASGAASVLYSYILCIKEIPLSSLDEAEFCSFDESSDNFVGDALRVLVTLELARLDHFGSVKRESQELLKVSSWLSRNLVSSEDQVVSRTLRRVASTFAEATNKDRSSAKRDHLSVILENLLLINNNEGSRVALEWLAVVMAYWCNGLGSDADLSLGYLCSTDPGAVHTLSDSALEQFYQVIVADLPFNLATFCRREKQSAIVFNRLYRLYKYWSANAVDVDTLDCLRQCIICCRNSQTKEDVFVTLTTSILIPNL
jgi:hypothetical protein